MAEASAKRQRPSKPVVLFSHPFEAGYGFFEGSVVQPLELEERFEIHNDILSLDEESRTRLLSRADGLVSMHGWKVNEDVLSKAPNLKVVSNYGVGYDNIDTIACATRGIQVTNTPDVLTAATADLTVTLILALCRNVVAAHTWTASGSWTSGPENNRFLGHDPSGQVLGIVGFGRIGQNVAQKMKVFGMKIIYADVFAPTEDKDYGFTRVTLEELYRTADFITIHCNATPDNCNMVAEKEISMMKRGVCIINCARGSLLDEKALTAALKTGQVRAAALDVFKGEPHLPKDLISLPNVICTPHVASCTFETRAAMLQRVVHSLDTVLLDNKPSPYCVNGDTLKQSTKPSRGISGKVPTVVQLIAKDAKQRGVKHIFGIPGSGSPMDLINACQDEGISFIANAHESSSAVIAGSYGRMLGTAGLCVVIKGPGAANLVGGAATAFFERLPVICISESRPTTMASCIGGAQLMGPHSAMFSSVCNYCCTVTAKTAATQLTTAVNRTALQLDNHIGPVLLDLPSDMATQPVTDPGLGAESSSMEIITTSKVGRSAVTTTANISSAVEFIHQCKRPVFLIGADCLQLSQEHVEQLVSIVSRRKGVMLTAVSGRGAVDETHHRWGGVWMGKNNTKLPEHDYLSSSEATDGVICIGVDIISCENEWNVSLPLLEITQHSSESLLTSFDPITKHAVRCFGCISDIIVQLNGCVKEEESTGWNVEEISAKLKAGRERVLVKGSHVDVLTSYTIIEAIQHLSPPDTVVFGETGVAVCILDYMITAKKPHTYFPTAGGRTMGLSIPALLGAKLACPSVPMIGICGDGSTLMRLGELETFRRCNIQHTPIVILNDACLGTIRARHKAKFPERAETGGKCLDFTTVDFAAIAAASGVNGVVCRSMGEFKSSLQTAWKAASTTVLDVRVDVREFQQAFAASIGAC